MKILFILVALLFLTACSSNPPQLPQVTLANHTFDIEIAESPEARTRGLMYRDELPDDQGMLFIYDESNKRSFWMKNMRFSIDILYFNSEKKLTQIYHNVPPCSVDPCEHYPSSSYTQYILEIPAGTSEKIGAKVGDKLSL
jgi:uncharacterized membrane protein (UPF0127 family)